ncbi:Non-specific lipid-transfer protein-like protein [Capsicum chinense]|nr:Non-specific lipid-transfer protein-like protein [Capsicum chinense]
MIVLYRMISLNKSGMDTYHVVPNIHHRYSIIQSGEIPSCPDLIVNVSSERFREKTCKVEDTMFTNRGKHLWRAAVISVRLRCGCKQQLLNVELQVQHCQLNRLQQLKNCNSLKINGSLSFVTNGSTEKKPQGTCCSGLKMVLTTDADCLCEGFKNSAQLGVVLNVTIAMSLPAACRVSASFVSNCGLSTYTGAAPGKVIVHHTQRLSSLFRKQQASPLILRHQPALMKLYTKGANISLLHGT